MATLNRSAYGRLLDDQGLEYINEGDSEPIVCWRNHFIKQLRKNRPLELAEAEVARYIEYHDGPK